MGDGANGSAFAKDSVPTRHKVLNHRLALGAVRCAKRRAGGLPLLVATDNAAFKVCVPRNLVISHSASPMPPSRHAQAAIASHDTSTLLDVPSAELRADGGRGSVLDGVYVQGCADCMINAVFGHTFSEASVRTTRVTV